MNDQDTTTTTTLTTDQAVKAVKPVVLRALTLARAAAGAPKSSNNFVALVIATVTGFAGGLARPGAAAVTKTLDASTKRFELEYTSNEDPAKRQNPDNPRPRTAAFEAMNAWINQGVGLSGRVESKKAKDAMWGLVLGTVGNVIENGVTATVKGESKVIMPTGATIEAGMKAYEQLLDRVEDLLGKGDKARAQSTLRAAGRSHRESALVIGRRTDDF